MTEDLKTDRSEPEPSYQGPERRDPRLPDRRSTHRGGRRATDTIARIADFFYKLLTEPPR